MHELRTELPEGEDLSIPEGLRYRFKPPTDDSASQSAGTLLHYAYVYVQPEVTARPFVDPPDDIGRQGDLWLDAEKLQLYYKTTTWQTLPAQKVVEHPFVEGLHLMCDPVSASVAWHDRDDNTWIDLLDYVELKEFTKYPLFHRLMKLWTSASSEFSPVRTPHPLISVFSVSVSRVP